jgi:hypothetical protein
MTVDLETLHRKSARHRAAVEASTLCGCFCCLRMYPPSEIKTWVARDDNDTAVCPHCSVDSVLPSSEVEITPELLTAMHDRWFPGL